MAQANTEKAREHFQEGLKLEAKGAFAEALAKFQEVAAVRRTPQVLFHVGFCQEHLGQWVEALATYKQGLLLAESSPSDPKVSETKSAIEQAIDGLEKRFASLSLKRGRGARNATISVDNKTIDDIREPLRMLPGKHVIQARARGKENFRSEIVLIDGQKMAVEISLESLENDPDPPPKDDPPPRPKGSPSSEGGPKGGRPITPYVVLGVGGASLAASGVFFLLRNNAQKELESQCVGVVCPASAKAQGDRAAQMNTLTNVTVSIGTAGVAVGLIWLLATSPSEPKPKASALQIVPSAGAHSLSTHLIGAF